LHFPNPSRENVMLEFDLSSNQSLHFRIVDVSGREIYFDQQSYSQGRGIKTIQISDWESGVYFVSVYDHNSSVPLVSGLKLFKY
ncbi:MAG TPA: T9SS type A sorting domain-containing protein, partial [Flavobacteriales bacterium]|nr:T9SS type A sorting domain-containing protein [Flavobacteriales bacterium]